MPRLLPFSQREAVNDFVLLCSLGYIQISNPPASDFRAILAKIKVPPFRGLISLYRIPVLELYLSLFLPERQGKAIPGISFTVCPILPYTDSSRSTLIPRLPR